MIPPLLLLVPWLLVNGAATEEADFPAKAAVGAVMSHLNERNPLVLCGGSDHGVYKSTSRTVLRTVHMPSRPLASLAEVTSSVVICAGAFAGGATDFLEAFALSGNFSAARRHPHVIVYSAVKDSWFEEGVVSNPAFSLAIDRMVFLLEKESLELTEVYDINGERVTAALGTVGRDDGRFRPRGEVGFLKRRANFYGQELKILAEDQVPYLDFRPYEKPQQKVGDGDHYPIRREDVFGMFVEVMDVLAVKLNFTKQYHRRFDEVWGDGTGTGMVGTLARGEVDLIGSSLTLKPERFRIVDYLYPLGTETYSLVIRNPGDREAANWNIFRDPFSRTLWTFLGLATAGLGIIIFAVDLLYDLKDGKRIDLTDWSYFTQAILNIWLVFSVYFGGKPSSPPTSARWGSRILMLSILMFGTVTFMGYRASLTSELATWKRKLPFYNLPEFILSDYNGGAIERFFTKAQAGSIFNEMYKAKMVGKRGGGLTPSPGTALAEMVSSEEPLALFSALESTMDDKSFHCKIVAAWKTDYPGMLAYAVPKNSTYRRFIYYWLLELLEGGTLSLIQKKWTKGEPHCPRPPVEGMGLAKLFTLFLICVLGYLLGVGVFLWELAMGRLRKRRPMWIRMDVLGTKNHIGHKETAVLRRVDKAVRGEIVDDKVIAELEAVVRDLKEAADLRERLRSVAARH